MKTTALLRTASLVALAQGVAHSVLFLRARPAHGPEEVGVIETMKSHDFVFAGFTRSYWDFYFGYGLFAALNVFIEAALFWQLAALAETDPSRVRPAIALFCVANVAYALLCLRFFFIVPVIPDLILAVCLGLAFMAARSRAA